MDTVTHGLAGWLTARALPKDIGRKEATVAVVIGSVLPDADHVATLLGSELYLRLHRGISHGFAGVALTSLLVALLVYRFGKWKDWKKLYLLVLLGQVLHVRAEDAVRSAARRYDVPVVSTAALPRLGEISVGKDLARIQLVGEAWAKEELEGLPDLPIPEHPGRFPFPAGPFVWNGNLPQ